MFNNRSKLISLLCAIVIGLVLTIGTLIALFAGGVLGGSKPTLSFSTHSATALYDGTPLTNHGWELMSGVVDSGHEISVSFTGSQTNVGESDNVMTVTVTDELGTDITDDYKIKYTYGKLRVNPRSITVTALGATKSYDGTALTYDRYTVTSPDKGLVTGHRAEVKITGSITEAGETFNTIESVTVYDYNGNDVTLNYRITLREEMLKVLGESEGGLPSFSGSSNLIPDDEYMDTVLYSVYAEKSGSVYLKRQSYGDYNGKGFDAAPEYDELIDGQYSAAYLSSIALEAAGGSKSLLKIRAISQSYALPYFMSVSDGKYDIQRTDAAFSGDASVEYSVYYLQYKDGVKIQGDNSLMSYESRYRAFVYANYLSIDTETYNFMLGLIKEQGFDKNDPNIINKVADYISKAAKYDLEYNTALDNEKNVAIAFLSEYKVGVCRHYAMAATMMYRALGIPARYTVGVVGQLQGGQWNSIPASQAHAWIEVYIDGLGWVDVDATGSSSSGGAGGGAGGGSFGGSGGQSNVIEVTPVEVSKKYDGTPLEATNSVKGLDRLLKQGYTYKAVVSGSRTEIGVSQSTIQELRVYDPSGKDVTDSLELSYKKGRIHVYSKEVTFVSGGYSKIYDGKVDDVTGTLSSSSALYDGHTYEVKNTAKASVGKHSNTFTVVIYDETGKDITDYYKVYKQCGTIEIEYAEITLEAGSATKKYDGTPLTCNELSIIQGELAEGHRIGLYEVTGSQTVPGRSDNDITYIVIFDKNGNDVTLNYAITYQVGQLKVTY